MYKVIFISLIPIIINSGCSVSKKISKDTSVLSQSTSEKALQITEEQNITNSSFFIERGRISTSGEGGSISLLFTMKYSNPGRYLISLKSTTGVEAFRAYLTKDTILINDRVNRTILYGKPFDFERISGLPSALLKVSLGDFFTGDKKKLINEKCINSSLTVNDYYQGLIIKSIIDCNIRKTKSLTITSGIPNELINIFYSKYKDDYYKTPERIEVNDFRRKVKIIIKIEKYSIPWNGEIEFVPGSGYKLKKLL